MKGTEHFKRTIQMYLEPVSYTHLDVYKRQPNIHSHVLNVKFLTKDGALSIASLTLISYLFI